MAADLYCVILMIVLVLAENEASAECNHGEVRLVDGCAPNEGRVEVCTCTSMPCSWGTVCDDFWGVPDAQVVCRQLGYRPADGVQALYQAYFGRGRSCQLISLDNVKCIGNETTLLDCHRDNELFIHNCNHGEDAGVRCRGNSSLLSNSIVNVSINNITSIISTHGINLYTVFITWKWKNDSMIQNQLNSLQIKCFSDRHHIGMSVNSTALSVELFGLLPSTSYNCCVSAVNGSYTARAVCTEIAIIQPSTSQTSPTVDILTNKPTVISESSTIQPSTCQNLESSFSQPTDEIPSSEILIAMPRSISTVKPTCSCSESPTIQLNTYQNQDSSFSASSSAADTIGGVLGFIIAILLILLTVLGAALVYLLRPKFFRNMIPKQSYATTPSQHSSSTTSAQAVRPTSAGQNETDFAAADEYSRIGPSYETIDSCKQQQRPAVDTTGGNQASESAIAMLSESSRYEFSDAHLALAETATMSCTADGVADSEVGLDYEAPQDLLTVKIEENEGYSHLQH